LVDNYSSSKILVYEVTDKRNADLFVFKSLRRVLNSKNDGIWYFTSYPSYSHKNIYLIVRKQDKQSFKNIINIYYVKSQFLAGWRNFDKVHLMQ
jgi:ABC-type molybdate transport system substrate-binding protein